MKTNKILWAVTAAAMLAAMPLGVSAEDSLLHSANFEGGTNGWQGFGSSSVSTTNNAAHGGTNSLWVGDRTDSWNGASCSMAGIMNAGETYNFTSFVMSNAASDTIMLTLKYTDASGEAVYKTMGQADATNTGWAEISGSYAVPSDASDILIYFQTAEGTNGFYVDDVSISGKAAWNTEALEGASLSDIYANYFRIGCAATPSELNTPISQDLVSHHFSCLTVGNELKPDYVLDKYATQAMGSNTEVAVSLDQARSVLSFCQERGIAVRGHVLLWHSQTPDWFFKENFSDSGSWVSKEIMSQRLENYIKAVMEAMEREFPDLDVYAWDVVNECYMDDGSLRPAGTDPSKEESRWTLIYGDSSYIDEAFTYARKYAPSDCSLFYNDYNEYIPGKRDAIFAKMSSLAEKDLIDGIGMQSHLDVGYPDANLYRQAIDKFNTTGLEIQVTELDITQYDNGGNLDKQTAAYESIMGQIVDAKRDGANITAVVFWGITDATSWRADGSPLLFDGNYAPKDSYYAVANQIDESEWGSNTQPPSQDTSEAQVYVEGLPEVIYVGDNPTEVTFTTNGLGYPNTITIEDESIAVVESSLGNGTFAIKGLKAGETKILVTVGGAMYVVEFPLTVAEHGMGDIIVPTMHGDVNMDGKVSIADVLALNKNLLSGEELSAEGILNADVDLDGSPTSSDALNILKYTVMILDSLPVTE